MKVLRAIVTAAVVALFSVPLCSAEINCKGAASNIEDFHYKWRMRGGLSWVAGLVFPTSGVGELKTTFPTTEKRSIESELLITSTDRSGFYVYQTQMDETGQNTLMTYHGYAWKNKSRKEQTVFDYIKRLAHIHKETPDKSWDKTEPLPPEQLRDVLTAIFYLRQNATTLQLPTTSIIYSDGKSYPVVIKSADRRTFTMQGQTVNAIGFEIVDAPGGKKWPGGIKVWVSDDPRRIPFRIEIQQSMASLQLDLQSVESCAFMQAAK
jgi:uncharacterized protein DUF3108